MPRNHLVYRDVPMDPRVNIIDPEPYRTSPKVEPSTVLALLKSGACALIEFEPGDWTKYRLALMPVRSGPAQRGVLVTNVSNYQAGPSAIVWDFETGVHEFDVVSAARALGRRGQWERVIFAWWLCEMLPEGATQWERIYNALMEPEEVSRG